jgi:hypothetical protein
MYKKMKAAPGTEQLSVIIALMIWGNNNQLNQLKNFKTKTRINTNKVGLKVARRIIKCI